MIKPMLAQARAEPFNCDKHLFEVKWDGTRCISFIEDGRLRLQNRHLMNIGDRYPELACLRGLPAGTVIDGEIVVLQHGKPSFQKLQQRDHLQDPTRIEILSKRMPVRLMAFDLPYVRGRRITGQPLSERRQQLIELVGRLGHPLLIVPDCVVGHGIEFFAGIVRHRLEGMMAKRIDSPYLIGRRSSDWLKIKVAHTADFEVIGCVPMRREKTIRVLLLGEKHQGRLVYKGKVGSGLTRRQRQDFLAELVRYYQPVELLESGFELMLLLFQLSQTLAGYLRLCRQSAFHRQ